MKTYKAAENLRGLFGLNKYEFALVLCLFFALAFIGLLLQILWFRPYWYYILLLGLPIGLIKIIQRYNNKKSPDYLMDLLSYRFVQPKRIDLNVQPEFKKINEFKTGNQTMMQYE